MTGKQTQGAVAYDGTGALKMAAPEAPAQKKKFRKKETKGKKETKETQHPVVKNGAALLTKGARWTVPGAILAILTVALVVVLGGLCGLAIMRAVDAAKAGKEG